MTRIEWLANLWTSSLTAAETVANSVLAPHNAKEELTERGELYERSID